MLFIVQTILYPDNLIYAAFALSGTKFYANTLLVALNLRQSHSAGSGPVGGDDGRFHGSTTVYGSV
ncbi:hypothetical protein C8Q76DRAFT_798529 [Earliella scabrosa]|nr:hypothetical protein C8Q76DRAFT_798529 [Earliella scabrosa]